ncbi:unnamed protein product [Ilex paraguariensis]|uniref:U-box domain-containing protein n=1 Tax=Ilex paraguariensis TaxID=185542 RepID=A0ABC8RKL7_9AQUA
MDGSEVQPFFICPIFLDIMKDPVTISTGMTFDRESIKKWFFSYNKTTCPVTKQPLTDQLLTNSNQNSSLTKLEDYKPRTISLIHPNQFKEGLLQSSTQKKTLTKIRLLIQENDDHTISMFDADIASLVASLMADTDSQCNSQGTSEKEQKLLKKPCQCRSKFKVVDYTYKAELKIDFFQSIGEILKDQNSIRGSLAVLSVLLEVLPHDNNGKKAVEMGIVLVLVELLCECNDRRPCENMLGVLDQLCRVAEGRATLLAHPAGLAAVSSKILRKSHVANHRAVNALLCVFRFGKSSVVWSHKSLWRWVVLPKCAW